jgi:ABC-type glycerol-3-phosphate transport system substrate-binding protein
MKMKRLLLITTAIAFLAVAFLCFSACGRSQNRDNNDAESNDTPAGVNVVSFTDTQTLTVAGPGGMWERMLRQAGDILQEEKAQQGIDLQITYIIADATTGEEFVDFYETILSLIAAGHGPDVFITHGFPIHPFVELRLLADIRQIMDGDFFDEVLDAYTVNGRLHAFPVTFGYHFIGINGNLPPSYVDRFTQLDRVSITEMILFYNDLQRDYPEYNYMAMAIPGIAHQGYAMGYGSYINIERMESRLNDGRFASFMNAMKPGLSREYSAEQRRLILNDIVLQSQNYVFSTPDLHEPGISNALLDMNTPYFTHYIPLADDEGRLVLGVSNLLSVSHLADGDLAWDFIGAFMRAESDFRLNGTPSLRMMPTEKELFAEYMEALQGSAVTARLLDYANQAAWLPPQQFYIPTPEVPLTRFTGDGELTAQEFAQLNHDAVLSWMGREVAVRNIPIPTPTPPTPEANVQHLTIRYNRGFYGFGGVIAQAEAAMNAERAARGDTYRVRIIADTHVGIDYNNTLRLQTQLMAGQGPDIFVMDFYPYWNYALSGYLVDIYTLIDQCAYFNREDFYNNVLKLFEVDGGLYTLPMNFGIEYMAINAGLPQEFLDRFAQLPVVNLTDMMEIYLDLMRDYGDEYGHLLLGGSVIFDTPGVSASSMLNGFIDYENRTANLTDERFVSFLRDYIKVFEGVMLYDNIGGYSGGFMDDCYRILSGLYVFRHEERHYEPVNAYLPRNNPYFIHHTPFADAQGRLIINQPPFADMWASFSFTSTGNTELAWEFMRHLIHAMVFPTEATRDYKKSQPLLVSLSNINYGTPILRKYFESYMNDVFKRSFDLWNPIDGYWFLDLFDGMDDMDVRLETVERAINRRAMLNEMEMSLHFPFIPEQFYYEPLNQLLRGLITPEAAAQRIQNMVSLWLMEQ